MSEKYKHTPRPLLTTKQKEKNARYGAAKYRAKREEVGYVSYQRYVPQEIKAKITQWVNRQIKIFEKGKN